MGLALLDRAVGCELTELPDTLDLLGVGGVASGGAASGGAALPVAAAAGGRPGAILTVLVGDCRFESLRISGSALRLGSFAGGSAAGGDRAGAIEVALARLAADRWLGEGSWSPKSRSSSECSPSAGWWVVAAVLWVLEVEAVALVGATPMARELVDVLLVGGLLLCVGALA